MSLLKTSYVPRKSDRNKGEKEKKEFEERMIEKKNEMKGLLIIGTYDVFRRLMKTAMGVIWLSPLASN